MFCANCGKQIAPGTNFCPACGTRVDGPSASYATGSGETAAASGSSASGSDPRGSWSGEKTPSPAPRLVRPRSPRILGGVCAAFAIHFGWNLNAVRILTAIFGLFYGVGILAYIACWILLPEAPYALPQQVK